MVVFNFSINKVAPKVKKVLQLLRLRQINNATFVKLNKASLNMLRIAQPYITYGYPTLKTVRDLLYKRGFVKVSQVKWSQLVANPDIAILLARRSSYSHHRQLRDWTQIAKGIQHPVRRRLGLPIVHRWTCLQELQQLPLALQTQHTDRRMAQEEQPLRRWWWLRKPRRQDQRTAPANDLNAVPSAVNIFSSDHPRWCVENNTHLWENKNVEFKMKRL